MQISWKSLFFLSKINIFWVWSYQKSHQNRVQNTFEKKVVQKSNFEWIWGRFLEVLEHQSHSERPRKSKFKKHRKSNAQMSCRGDANLWFHWRPPRGDTAASQLWYWRVCECVCVCVYAYVFACVWVRVGSRFKWQPQKISPGLLQIHPWRLQKLPPGLQNRRQALMRPLQNCMCDPYTICSTPGPPGAQVL